MTDPYAFILRRTGGPEILEAEHIDVPRPGPGEVLVRNEAVGLNFIDTYHRSGLYRLPLPSGLGGEGAGVVEAVGEEVAGFREGDRVGYFTGPPGAYATHRTIDPDRLVKLPESLTAEQAAAAMLKGCTAEYLIERCARVEPGQVVLVHAAAGGMGTSMRSGGVSGTAAERRHDGSRSDRALGPCPDGMADDDARSEEGQEGPRAVTLRR